MNVSLVSSCSEFTLFLFKKQYAPIFQVCFTFLFQLETVRSIKKVTCTLTIHPPYHIRWLLLLHRNQPTDLQSNLVEWFLYDRITGVNKANPSHHLFQIYYFLLKPFFAPFPKCQTLPDLFHNRCNLKNYLIMATSNFMIIRLLIKSNFIALLI